MSKRRKVSATVISGGDAVKASTWAANTLVAELRDLGIGLACNVQDWARVGVKKNVAECARRRREARRLLKIAILAVRRAQR